jgi:hypothetical protein
MLSPNDESPSFSARNWSYEAMSMKGGYGRGKRHGYYRNYTSGKSGPVITSGHDRRCGTDTVKIELPNTSGMCRAVKQKMTF